MTCLLLVLACEILKTGKTIDFAIFCFGRMGGDLVNVVDELNKVFSRLSSRIQVLFDMKDLRIFNHQIM